MSNKRRCNVRPYEGPEEYIFVSYCHKDQDCVYPLIEQLAKDGFRVWYDEGINPGSEWPEIIASHLSNAAVCVAIVSGNSLSSHNCRREITFALLKKKCFVSVFLEPVDLTPGVEMQLSSYQSIFKYQYEKESEFFKKLYEPEVFAACRGIINLNIVSSQTDRSEEAEKRRLEYLRKKAEEAERRCREAEEQNQKRQEEIARLISEQERIRKESEEQTARLRKVSEMMTSELERLRSEAEEAVRLRMEAEKTEPPRLDEGEQTVYVSGTEKRAVSDYQLVRMSTGEVIDILLGVFVIGRSAVRADYVIRDDRTVGRVHALLVANESECKITDNHSLNKTVVNGKALEPDDPYSLKEGDVIQISKERFMFRKAVR